MAKLIERLDMWSARVGWALSLVGGIICAMAGIGVIVDVLGRDIFNHPVPLITATLIVTAPLLFALGVSYVQVSGSHIRVTILSTRLKRRPKQVVEVTVLVISLLMVTLLTWLMARQAVQSCRIGESYVGFVTMPTYQTKVGLALAVGWLWLRYFVDLVRYVSPGTKQR
jgi:TRAP-type mannitol/chloroaromatic compound transport system permease small subunit